MEVHISSTFYTSLAVIAIFPLIYFLWELVTLLIATIDSLISTGRFWDKGKYHRGVFFLIIVSLAIYIGLLYLNYQTTVESKWQFFTMTLLTLIITLYIVFLVINNSPSTFSRLIKSRFLPEKGSSRNSHRFPLVSKFPEPSDDLISKIIKEHGIAPKSYHQVQRALKGETITKKIVFTKTSGGHVSVKPVVLFFYKYFETSKFNREQLSEIAEKTTTFEDPNKKYEDLEGPIKIFENKWSQYKK